MKFLAKVIVAKQQLPVLAMYVNVQIRKFKCFGLMLKFTFVLSINCTRSLLSVFQLFKNILMFSTFLNVTDDGASRH